MFIGHLPAGYLMTRAVYRGARRLPFWAGLAGSLFPDVDVLWFYAASDMQTSHHAAWTHIPATWLCLYAAAELVTVSRALRPLRTAMRLFFLGVLLHMVLDTVVGGIRWLAPLSPAELSFFNAEVRYDWWVLNFVLHWTFALEILVVVAALVVGLSSLARVPARWPHQPERVTPAFGANDAFVTPPLGVTIPDHGPRELGDSPPHL